LALGVTWLLDIDLLRRMELCEAAGWETMCKAAPPDVQAAMGMRMVRIGGAMVGITPKVDILAYNRTIGLGIGEPATAGALDRIIETYREAGVPRFFVLWPDFAEPGGFPEVLRQRGLSHYNNWAKLYRDLKEIPSPRTDLRIEAIGPERSADFARIISTAFEWPEITGRYIAGPIGQPGWRHYLAFDGDRPVAAACYHAHDGIAWLEISATLPEARGRGAQTALIARRLQDGAEDGCTVAMVETAEQTPSKEAPSYRNVTRMGFQVAHLRPNYIMKFNP